MEGDRIRGGGLRRGLRRAALAVGALALVLAVPVALYANLFDELAEARIERAGGALAPSERPADAYRVVLISIDGLAPRVLDATETPVLDGLRREGLHARHAETVPSSRTLPAHVSMISGVPPSVHGVTWNRYTPWRGVDVYTVFSACRAAALRCGLFAGKAKLAHLAEGEEGVERFARGGDAADVLRRAYAYLEARDPAFLMVHVADVDLAGHAEGWGSDLQRRQLRRIDELLGDFVTGALDLGSGRLAVIVTSDHGGHGTDHGTTRPEDLEIPWILWGQGIAAGVLEQPVRTEDTAATLLALLDLPIPADWQGRPLYRPGVNQGSVP